MHVWMEDGWVNGWIHAWMDWVNGQTHTHKIADTYIPDTMPGHTHILKRNPEHTKHRHAS